MVTGTIDRAASSARRRRQALDARDVGQAGLVEIDLVDPLQVRRLGGVRRRGHRAAVVALEHEELVVVDGEHLVDPSTLVMASIDVDVLVGLAGLQVERHDPVVDADAAGRRRALRPWSWSSAFCMMPTSMRPSGVMARPSIPRLACRPEVL